MTHIKIPDVPRTVSYTADGVETIFVYGFPIFDENDIDVYLDSIIQPIGYSVTGAGETEGGTIVFDTAPTTATIVALVGDKAIKRSADFQTAGALFANTVNDEFDILTVNLQEREAAESRALRFPVTEFAADPLPAAADRANKFLAFDSSGQPAPMTDAPTSELLSEKITLLDTIAAYALPSSIQSGADEDNYAVTLVDGSTLIRGSGYDFTVASDILTLTTTPTVANGLAGQEVLVELVRPGIDSAVIANRSVTAPKIGLGAVLSEHFGFPSQALGSVLFNDGTDWLSLAAPTGDGEYKLQMTVAGGGATKAPTWEKGGTFDSWGSATKISSALNITATLPDNDVKMTSSDGTQILTRSVSLSPNARRMAVWVHVNASCGDNQTIRVGLFRDGSSIALQEGRYKAKAPSGTNNAREIDFVFEDAVPPSENRTYSVRIACTNTTCWLNTDVSGSRFGGGNIASTMFIQVLGSSA